MIFGHNSIQYTIDNPEHEYTTTIELGMKKMVSADRAVSWYDYTSSKDYRTTSFKWKMGSTYSSVAIDLFSDVFKARTDTVEFVMNGVDWIYPFGPDLGNAGNFTADCVEYDTGEMLLSPWRYFDFSASFVMVSKPLYSIPTAYNEGDVQVGTISGLSYPKRNLVVERNLFTTQTATGDVYKIDGLEKYDNQILNLTFELRTEKAAKLINYLTETARGNSFNIVTQNYNWLFGEEGGSSGTYAVKLADNKIVVTHRKPRRFDVSFSVYRSQI